MDAPDQQPTAAQEPASPAPPASAQRPVTLRGVTLPETVEAPIQPLDVTGVRTVTTGTALFAVASVVALLQLDWLREHDRMWWLWTCLVGVGLGFFGYAYCTRRARHVASNRHRTHTLD